MVEMILFIMFAHLIPLGKGIADITADTDNWSKSIFSEFNPIGFFGPKDQTWVRKYKGHWIFNNILVFVTDIWHFANFITKIGWYGCLITILFLPDPFYYVFMHFMIVTIFFHLLYHDILRK